MNKHTKYERITQVLNTSKIAMHDNIARSQLQPILTDPPVQCDGRTDRQTDGR